MDFTYFEFRFFAPHELWSSFSDLKFWCGIWNPLQYQSRWYKQEQGWREYWCLTLRVLLLGAEVLPVWLEQAEAGTGAQFSSPATEQGKGMEQQASRSRLSNLNVGRHQQKTTTDQWGHEVKSTCPFGVFFWCIFTRTRTYSLNCYKLQQHFLSSFCLWLFVPELEPCSSVFWMIHWI